jgi:hypothetical protein
VEHTDGRDGWLRKALPGTGPWELVTCIGLLEGDAGRSFGVASSGSVVSEVWVDNLTVAPERPQAP